MINLKRMVSAYIECALWASIDYESETPLDEIDAPLNEVTETRMLADCTDFIAEIIPYMGAIEEAQITSEQMGHDFWLTRNRHGAGFWDRGLGRLGDKLTEVSQSFKECDLYIGDDGEIHIA